MRLFRVNYAAKAAERVRLSFAEFRLHALTHAELGGFSIGGSEDQKRGARGGPPLPGAPMITRGFIGNRPSRCNFLRASLRARRTASAFSRAFFSEGFS